MQYHYSFIIRLLLCFIPASFFLLIFYPLTIYSVYFLLYFSHPILSSNFITIKDKSFEFVNACIVPYAYYLFWILIMLTKEINLKTRIKMIIFGFISIFIINIFRILLLIFLVLKYDLFWFNLIHMLFWYFLSGVLVALIWILLIKYYKIKSIPVYDDIKTLFKLSKK